MWVYHRMRVCTQVVAISTGKRWRRELWMTCLTEDRYTFLADTLYSLFPLAYFTNYRMITSLRTGWSFFCGRPPLYVNKIVSQVTGSIQHRSRIQQTTYSLICRLVRMVSMSRLHYTKEKRGTCSRILLTHNNLASRRRRVTKLLRIICIWLAGYDWSFG